MRTVHDAELNKLNSQHQKIIEQFNKDAESASAKIKEEMTEQVIKAQQTMQAALQEQENVGDQHAAKVSGEYLLSVHETLEGVLRDTFNVEDGARLSSLQSYQAGQTPLETLLDEFKQLIEQLNLTKKDEQVFIQLEKLW